MGIAAALSTWRSPGVARVISAVPTAHATGQLIASGKALQVSFVRLGQATQRVCKGMDDLVHAAGRNGKNDPAPADKAGLGGGDGGQRAAAGGPVETDGAGGVVCVHGSTIDPA